MPNHVIHRNLAIAVGGWLPQSRNSTENGYSGIVLFDCPQPVHQDTTEFSP